MVENLAMTKGQQTANAAPETSPAEEAAAERGPATADARQTSLFWIKRRHQRLRPSLRLVLVICLVGLQLFAVTAVVFFTNVSTQQALERQSRNLLEEAGSAVAARVKEILAPARQAAILSARLAENGVLNLDDILGLESHMFRMLQSAPQLSGMYFADADGRFVFVMRGEEEGVFRTKVIPSQTDGSGAFYMWRDSGFGITRTSRDVGDSYDPRTRPWFKTARDTGAAVWTDPYIFFTSRKPGLSFAAPVVSEGRFQGAFGVDLEIDVIANFLADNWASRNGASLILTRDGQVIAHPQVSYDYDAEAGPIRRFDALSDLEDSIAGTAFGRHFDAGPAELEGVVFDAVNLGRQEYVTLIRAIEDWELPWLIAIYAPRDNFIGEVLADRVRSLWIALAVIALSGGIGIFLAERINQPLRTFARQSRKVASEGADPQAALQTPYKELDETGEALVQEYKQRRRFEMAYGRTFDMASRGMAQLDPDTGAFVRVNAQLAHILGAGPEGDNDSMGQFVDQPLSQYLAVVDGEHHGSLLGGFLQDVRQDREFSIEACFVTQDGGRIWLRMSALLIRNEDGTPDHILAIFDDVNEAREASERVARLKRELSHASRVNVMGEFASGLAHELNQPLSAIVMDADTAQLTLAEQTAPDPELRDILREIETQALRAGEIIRALRNVVRKDKGILRPFDLGALAEETLALMEPEARDHGVALALDYTLGADGAAQVVGNRTQIAQVIVNLLRNAIEAVSALERPDALVVLRLIDRGDEVEFEVEDNGPGLAGEGPMFTKFETAKADGMGLGLSICRSIVGNNHGRFWHETVTPQGARFCVALPAAPEESQRETRTNTKSPAEAAE